MYTTHKHIEMIIEKQSVHLHVYSNLTARVTLNITVRFRRQMCICEGQPFFYSKCMYIVRFVIFVTLHCHSSVCSVHCMQPYTQKHSILIEIENRNTAQKKKKKQKQRIELKKRLFMLETATYTQTTHIHMHICAIACS